jgi:hypothetical protein
VLKVNYAPIEQYADARDMVQGPWSDLYSLAAVVHGYLANDVPLPATFRVLRDRMPSMRDLTHAAQAQHGGAYSVVFVDTLDRSLAIRPEERPQSVEAFVEALELQVPPDMARFDWRSAMGEGWLLSRDEQAARAKPQPADLAEQPTQFEYRPKVSTLAVAERVAAAPDVLAGDGHPKGVHRRVWFGVVAMLFALVLGGGGYWAGYFTSALAVVAQAPAAKELQTVKAAVVSDVVVEATALAASSVAPAASEPGEVKKVRSKPRAVAVRSKPPSAPSMVQAPPREARVSTTVVELCPESNFITRPMCMFRECKKPEFAELPMCVENTQRLQANQQRRF